MANTVQLSSLHILLFKVIKVKYFTQGKCEFMNFLFVLLDKIKNFSLCRLFMLCVHLILKICILCKSIDAFPTSNCVLFVFAYLIDTCASAKLHLPFQTPFLKMLNLFTQNSFAFSKHISLVVVNLAIWSTGPEFIPDWETLNFYYYFFTHLLLDILVNVPKYVKKKFFGAEKKFINF